MDPNLRLSLLSSLASLFVAGCISAANVDAPGASAGGADTSAQGGIASSTGGSAAIVTSVGPTGGSKVNSGGGAAPVGGTKATGVGGSVTIATGGVVSVATGGSPASTTPAPTNSLGVYVIAGAKGNTGSIEFDIRIDNKSSQSVDLSNVTLRYWYQDEGLGTALTFASYYISVTSVTFTGNAAAASNPVAGADHYLELSLTGTLPQGQQVELKFAAHTAGYQGTVDLTNDYSYNAGATGYDDKITLYSAGSLIWGTEPGSTTTPPDGTGGAPSTVVATGGASSTADATGGAPSTVVATGGASSTADATGGASSTADATGGASSTADATGGAPSTSDATGGADGVGGDTSAGGSTS